MKKIISAVLFSFALSVTAFAQRDVKEIDFNNFTYEPFCAGEESQKITVKDGEFSKMEEVDGIQDRLYFKAFSVTYGDLTGDKKDEAIVLTVCNTGGTGNFTEGFIYGVKTGKPALLARIPGGDRAYGGLREAFVENGLLVVEANDVGEAGGACCPEFVVTGRYKLTSGKLTESGKSSRRELYPKQRINFAKGKSGTTFNTTIETGGINRFMVGARAGQTLIVSINSKNASLRLLEDADVKEESTKLTAKLPKNGNYTFEVQNLAETDSEITVTVEIK